MGALSDTSSIPVNELLSLLKATEAGLTGQEAESRLLALESHILKPHARTRAVILFLAQFKSPLTIILLAATALSFLLNDHTNAVIILAIVLAGASLSFWQEATAADAIGKLLNIVRLKARVLRDGAEKDIFIDHVVPGDIVLVSAGDVVPGDCRILESNDVFIDEATLTGETYPVEKAPGMCAAQASLSRQGNMLWMGTHVISGSARALVVASGSQTKFGQMAQQLKLTPPETEFERGVRHFGFLLMEVTLVLVIIIFAVNVFLGRPVLDTFLFSLALAVGLTPQLLPAIISINLAHGAKRMAAQHVIVKRLASIENFGSMNVLCSDKTGTLTTGVATVHSMLDINGHENDKIFLYAYLNAYYETGFTNPIDESIRSFRSLDLSGYSKLDEIPYDFLRKKLSILVLKDNASLMVSKGALANIVDVCTYVETAAGQVTDITLLRGQINQQLDKLSQTGLRVLGVAYRNLDTQRAIQKTDESGMTFLGFLLLTDPLKPGIVQTISQLNKLGVSLKVITGDNYAVAAAIGKQIGLSQDRILKGSDLRQMSAGALVQRANSIDIFSEIEPDQKERIITALKKAGNVVGYIGDGINDASALHAADVGISVDSAVDVAKEAADIVLLKHDLNVLVQGVREGRVTFANTLKYVFMATSANFGNMVSMAGASLFMPFLPLLPKQVLLINLMTDLPEMAIATDRVDPESVNQPRRFDIKFIRRFMIVFGLISSVFDFITFGVLLFLLHATESQFRTGWFMESVISASLIVLSIRTRRSVVKSRPGKYLTLATIGVILIALILPWTPVGVLFGFSRLPGAFFPVLGIIIVLYVLTVEAAKRVFYKISTP